MFVQRVENPIEFRLLGQPEHGWLRSQNEGNDLLLHLWEALVYELPMEYGRRLLEELAVVAQEVEGICVVIFVVFYSFQDLIETTELTKFI